MKFCHLLFLAATLVGCHNTKYEVTCHDSTGVTFHSANVISYQRSSYTGILYVEDSAGTTHEIFGACSYKKAPN